MRSGVPIVASVVIGINSNLFTSNAQSIDTIYLNRNFQLIIIPAIILIIYQMYIASLDKNNSNDIIEKLDTKLDTILANTTPKPTASEILDTPDNKLSINKKISSQGQIESISDTIKLLMSKNFVKKIEKLGAPDKEKLNRFLQSISYQNVSQLLSSRILYKVKDSDAYIFRVTSDLRAVGFIDRSKNEIIFANIEKRR